VSALKRRANLIRGKITSATDTEKLSYNADLGKQGLQADQTNLALQKLIKREEKEKEEIRGPRDLEGEKGSSGGTNSLSGSARKGADMQEERTRNKYDY